MHRPHLTHNLRSLAFVMVAAAIFGGIGVVWWANRTGLPASWRAVIEGEISKHGPPVEIGGLQYIPFKGVIATDVKVFTETMPRREISRLERVLLDIDKTKLARGKFHLNKIELDHARLELPVQPDNPDSEILHVSDASGTILMPGDKRLEIRGAHGRIAGIDVTLDARIIGYRQVGAKPPDANYLQRRRELIARIIEELGKWHFDPKRPPAIQIRLDGDTNDLSSLRAGISLQVRDMEKSGHQLDELTARAEISGDLITVSSLRATDARGELNGRLDYDLGDREGRFDISSSLDIPHLLGAWAGAPPLPGVEIGGRQLLEAGGDFRLDEENKPHFKVTGHARGAAVTLKGVPFDVLETTFAWDDASAYLRDIRLVRHDGQATGKALIEWPLVRLELATTLPPPVYVPFFINHPLEHVLRDFTVRKGAEVDVKLEGSFDATNHTAWAYTGTGRVKNLSYRGVPVHAANCAYTLNHNELDFHDGAVDFDYSAYPLRSAFGGPDGGVAKIGRIRYDAAEKIVQVEAVQGAIWAAPMVRLFAPKVADSLEQYRFHRPPDLKAAGVVDVTPAGRTALDVSFSSNDASDFRFLGKNLTLGAPSGTVALRGSDVQVNDLRLSAFGGPVTARFDSLGGQKLAGELSWTKLALEGLAEAYGFPVHSGGEVTGRIKFTMTAGNVRTLEGRGLIALERARLFSVPMFGPLTSLVGAVLNNDKAGVQQANSAFCTFRIERGILHSHDFHTSTRSIDFTGEGDVDLDRRTLDMTIRMNARGLLKFLTLPLRPFAGLFQFRGSGPLRDPDWRRMKLTDPAPGHDEPAAAVPRAMPVEGPE